MPTENATPDLTPATRPGARAADTRRYLTIVGLVFLALVMVLEPDVGFTAPPVARLLFWGMQIAAGLVVLQSVLRLLTRLLGGSRVPSWALVASSGIVGAAALAPIYWLIGEGMMERWLGYAAIPDSTPEGVDTFTVAGVLLEEFVDIVGPVTTAWALICLPRLHWMVPPVLNAPTRASRVAPDVATGVGHGALVPDVATPAPERQGVATRRSEASQVDASPAAGHPRRDVSAAVRPAEHPCAPPEWYARLPPELGTDVIAVASELQYLRVWTPRGCALVLGSLTEVEAAGGAAGLRVHRSWWVACRHVAGVRRTPTGGVCLMSDGREVPVSRRRRADVFARFGDGARYVVPGSSEAVSQADLD